MKFTVLQNLRHDKVDYEKGDLVEIQEKEQYQVLIEMGVIEKDKSEKAEKKKEIKE